MNKKQPGKGRGGKLSRSEIVHLRLNPRTRFALEFMARSENRTVSSFLETLVNEKISSFNVKILPPAPRSKLSFFIDEKDLETVSLQELLKLAWHVDERHRFIAMCIYTPHLLSYEEEHLWSAILLNNYYWSFYEIEKIHHKTGKSLGKEKIRIQTLDSVVWEHLEAHWDWLVADDITAIRKDIEKKGILQQPGKIVSTPPGFDCSYNAFTDEEAFDFITQFNASLDSENKKRKK